VSAGARRLAAAVLAAGALIAGVPPASASIKIQDSETLTVLQEFDKADCRVVKNKTIKWRAFSQPADDLYTLDVFVNKSAWNGFGEYDLLYGDPGVEFFVFGPDHDIYSNTYGIPGTPPGVFAGGLKISKNGKRYSVGAYGLSNEAFTKGIAVSGSARCKAPKRR
jgi:hypothetical protein